MSDLVEKKKRLNATISVITLLPIYFYDTHRNKISKFHLGARNVGANAPPT